MNIKWARQSFRLLPERALLWEDKATLILSDIHLGKAHDFQAIGVPVPATIHDHDLERIERLLRDLRPERVFVLGDFVHSHRTPLDELASSFRAIKARHPARWTLTVGNHDWAARHKLAAWHFDEIQNEIREGGIYFSHGHTAGRELSISGHMHPVYKLGNGRDRLRLPCFWVRSEEITLPSFGEFTGGFEIKPKPNDDVYVVSDEHVFKIESRRKL